MIIEGNVNTIERSGGVNENKFTIEANGKAFRVLSDSLYPDKPKAILRELSCNAYDAHVAAGCADKPFSIHLPTAIEPWLSIRDYGIGLTPEEMCGYWKTVVDTDGKEDRIFVGGIYNTFFKSTKTNSNDFIGALGLGSKSPFSYVDSFTVVSRKDGIKYSFTAYINENDEPEIVELGREETFDGNGLEVTMPVKRNDYTTFADKARSVLQWFDPQPEVTGVSNWQSNQLNPQLRGTNWIANENAPYGHYGAMAIQGKVAYPIDYYALGVDRYTDKGRKYYDILRSNLVIEFPIGSLDVTASRETLSYKESTINNIYAALDVVIAELPKQMEAEMQTCKTEWEARIKFNTIRNNVPVMNSFYGDTPFMWRGKKFLSYDNHVSIKYQDFKELTASVISYGTSTRRKVFASQAAGNSEFIVSPNERCYIYFDDIKRGGLTRARTAVRESHGDKMIVLIQGADAAAQKKILAAFGSPPSYLTSSLPVPERKTSSDPTKRSAYREFDIDYDVSGQDLDYEDVEFDNGGIYLPMLRSYPCVGDRKDNNFSHMLYAAKNSGLYPNGLTVIGVLRSKVKAFEDDAKWINFYDDLKDRATKALAAVKLEHHLAVERARNRWMQSHERYTSRWVTAECGLPEDHPFMVLRAQMAADEAAAKRDAQKVNQYRALMNLMTSMGWSVISMAAEAQTVDYVQEWQELNKRYPLLEKLNIYSYTTNEVSAIVEYVKAIDIVKPVL